MMPTAFTSAGLIDAGKALGVPFVILLIVLTQIGPKIDHGIAIADHVDAELQYLAARGCAPIPIQGPVAWLP